MFPHLEAHLTHLKFKYFNKVVIWLKTMGNTMFQSEFEVPVPAPADVAEPNVVIKVDNYLS